MGRPKGSKNGRSSFPPTGDSPKCARPECINLTKWNRTLRIWRLYCSCKCKALCSTFSDEHKRKISIAQIGNKYRSGISHTAESKSKLSLKLKGRTLSVDDRRNKSIAAVKNILNGSISKKYYRYQYGNVSFKSSWELSFAKFLDEHNIIWSYESASFEYQYYEYKKSYVPDFYLPDLGYYIEIHPSALVDNKMMTKIRSVYPHVILLMTELSWIHVTRMVKAQSNARIAAMERDQYKIEVVIPEECMKPIPNL
jgi:hypothetical protein